MTETLNDPALAALDGIAHAFFTRRGGVSRGLFASLNVGFGSGDDAAHVAENRARAAHALGFDGGQLSTAHQVHSAQVAVIDAPVAPRDAPRADGFVTRTRGVVLGVLTADCAPVLLADAEAGVVGAAHAGWRGALGGVVEAAVRAMESVGAARERIVAAVGPCIGKGSYEVGTEFPAPFLEDDAAARRFFGRAERPGRFMFDLEGYVAHRLARLGLAAVGVSGADTCADADRFFSYRRTTLAGERDYGRGLSAIALEE